MTNPKIVIVLSPLDGIESVTISSTDPRSRALGYEICQSIEQELFALSAAIRNFKGNIHQGDNNERLAD